MGTVSLRPRGVLTGLTEIPAFTPPPGTTLVAVQVSLSDIISMALDFSFTVELSRDSGATWISAGGCGLSLPRSGGVLVAGGLEIQSEAGGVFVAASTDLNISLVSPTDLNTRVRASLTTNEPFTATITGVVL
jgi:hypothetical protein